MAGFRGNSQQALCVFVYVSVVLIEIGCSHIHQSHPAAPLHIELQANPNIGLSSVANVCMCVCVGGLVAGCEHVCV